MQSGVYLYRNGHLHVLASFEALMTYILNITALCFVFSFHHIGQEAVNITGWLCSATTVENPHYQLLVG